MNLKKLISQSYFLISFTGTWDYRLKYVDQDDVYITFSKQGFTSKKEAVAHAEVKRMDLNKYMLPRMHV